MLFEPYVPHIVFKFGKLSGRLSGNSWSLGLRYVFKKKYLIVNLVFPTSVFLSGTFILSAPFPDHYLLVPFQMLTCDSEFLS